MKRFIVVDDNESGHWGFVATVIDTWAEEMVDENICECFDKEHAKKICNLLNEANKIDNKED